MAKRTDPIAGRALWVAGLGAPLILGCFAPPWAALFWWLAAFPLHLATLRGAPAHSPRRLLRAGWLSAAMLGLAVAAARAAPSPPGALASAAAVLAATGALPRGVVRWLGLAPPAPGLPTPEGARVRPLGCGELAMGGPISCSYMLPDGAILEDCGERILFSPDGQYAVSTLPTRQEWEVLIYDRRTRVLHRCPMRGVREVVAVDAATITVRPGEGRDLPGTTAPIAALLARGRAVPMVPVADIWIARDRWEGLRHAASPFAWPPPPEGAPSLAGLSAVPSSLRALDHPLGPLADPGFELIVEGAPSGLILSARRPDFVWRPDGHAFACYAAPRQGDGSKGYHLWERGRGWRRLPDRPPLAGCLPPLLRHRATSPDADSLSIACELGRPSLTEDGFGRMYGFSFSARDVDGCDAAEVVTMLQEKILLHPARQGGPARFEIPALAGGLCLRWEVVGVDAALRRAVCRCTLGDRPLEETWLLVHCVQPDRRRIALVAYAPPPAAPHRLAIFDLPAGTRTWAVDRLPDPWPLALGADRLDLLYLAGADGRTPRQSSAPPPDPEQAGRLLRQPPPVPACYRARTLRI